MAEGSEPIEVHPDEHKPVDPNQREENVAVLVSSTPDPQTDKPTDERQDKTKQASKPLTLDFKWTTDLIAVLALVISAISLGFSYLTVAEMRETNRLTSDTLVISQRPWLSAELRLTSDLRFDENGGHLGVETTLRNSGSSPALNTHVSQLLVVDYMDTTEIETRCGRVATPDELGKTGDPVFPGDSFRVSNSADVSQTAVQAALTSNRKKYNASIISVTLFTCIQYRSSLDNKVHQTRYFRMVGPRPPFALVWPLPGGIYKDTQLWRWPHGQYAD